MYWLAASSNTSIGTRRISDDFILPKLPPLKINDIENMTGDLKPIVETDYYWDSRYRLCRDPTKSNTEMRDGVPSPFYSKKSAISRRQMSDTCLYKLL